MMSEIYNSIGKYSISIHIKELGCKIAPSFVINEEWDKELTDLKIYQ